MANSVGIDGRTGKALTDWGHTQQSIEKILTTAFRELIMLREFGSDLPDLVDAKMTRRNVLAVYAASAIAIDRWEPRFALRSAAVRSLQATGKIELVYVGAYYPRGHKGDFSIEEDKVGRVVFDTSSIAA